MVLQLTWAVIRIVCIDSGCLHPHRLRIELMIPTDLTGRQPVIIGQTPTCPTLITYRKWSVGSLSPTLRGHRIICRWGIRHGCTWLPLTALSQTHSYTISQAATFKVYPKTMTKPNWLETLKRDGYVVVPNVIPDAACDEFQESAWEWLESFPWGFKRDDRSTWVADKLPYGVT